MLAMVHCLPLSKRESYLDYGCGSGYGTELLATYFDVAIGLDRDDHALYYALQNHRRSGAHFVKEIPPQYRFDFITCIEMIEHLDVEQAYRLLDRFRDILDPDGSLVLTTPLRNPEGKPNPHHLHEYTVEELDNMLSNRFNVVEIQDISMGIPNLIAICREPKK